MNFLPFEFMWKRVEIAKQNSEDACFNSLMYMGEMFTKFTVAGMLAGIDDGRERHQYRLKYRLVRADGIGEWSQALDEMITGVPRQYLTFGGDEINQLTQKVKEGEWQYDSVYLLDKCLKVIEPQTEKLATKVSVRNWFKIFTELRNKTRGHGAVYSHKLSQICEELELSIRQFQDNFSLFQLDWAYLKQSFSRKKYHVINLNNNSSSFEFLKTQIGKSHNFSDGIYIFFDQNGDTKSIRKVDMIYSNIDMNDFFLPNGNFKDKQYETISYISGDKVSEDSKYFLTPIDQLPPSETQGKPDLLQHGKECITNLPSRQRGYIVRKELEESLYKEIVEPNEHRIITLIGRGGIGKTWLALEVLNGIADKDEFQAIFWFSARDIDLLSDGAKQVKPHILNQEDIAKEFFRLFGTYFFGYEEYQERIKNIEDQLSFLREKMSTSELGKILFVFDNFETVKSPGELYSWIDTYLRSPNKALITTRFREFKGDNPVELTGMHQNECRRLIDETANKLGIQGLLTEDSKNRIYDESEGHPYIVKILLGEIKKTGKFQKPEHIISQKVDILDSLFERTYSSLSLAAKRIFLTLCAWKSLIAQTALEAVLLQRDINVQQAVDDLSNSSLIETIDEDDEVFLSVPLVAIKFGQRKLSINPMEISIKDDVELLKLFGVVQETDVRNGIEARIKRLFNEINNKIKIDVNKMTEYEHIIEFLARKYPYTWLYLAKLYKNVGQLENYVITLKKYLEFSDDYTHRVDVLTKLINYYSAHNDPIEDLYWRLQLSKISDIDYETISETSNRFNGFMSSNSNVRNNWDESEKYQILETLINLMERRIDEASAKDCSRLGWLYVHYNNKTRAIEIAKEGLQRDPKNEYCMKLLRNLNATGY